MLRLIQNQLFESICARNICLHSALGYTRHTVFVVVIVVSSTHIQSGSGCNREPSRWEGVVVIVMMMMMMMVVVVIWRKGSKPAISDHILGTNLPPVFSVMMILRQRWENDDKFPAPSIRWWIWGLFWDLWAFYQFAPSDEHTFPHLHEWWW